MGKSVCDSTFCIAITLFPLSHCVSDDFPFADLHEMLLNREETVWAGNLLMAQYLPDVIGEVSKRRLFNVTSIGENAVVTACVSEYAALKAVEQDRVEILSLEDLILG